MTVVVMVVMVVMVMMVMAMMVVMVMVVMVMVVVMVVMVMVVVCAVQAVGCFVVMYCHVVTKCPLFGLNHWSLVTGVWDRMNRCLHWLVVLVVLCVYDCSVFQKMHQL